MAKHKRTMGFFVAYKNARGQIVVAKYGTDKDIDRSHAAYWAWRKRMKKAGRKIRVLDRYFATGEWTGVHVTAGMGKRKRHGSKRRTPRGMSRAGRFRRTTKNHRRTSRR